jgi:hypothetical protein
MPRLSTVCTRTPIGTLVADFGVVRRGKRLKTLQKICAFGWRGSFKKFLISSSFIAVGLAVPAIHMLRATPETPISSAIRGMLWSEFSTNRIRSPKSRCSSDSSEPIAFVWSGERNRFAMLIVSSFPVPSRLKKSVTKKVNLGSFGYTFQISQC